MPLPVRRAYAGAAEACTLSSSLNNSATSFSITGTTTAWPSTATGPFYMVIDPGLSTEEKVLVGARTGGSLSSVTRGVDGTSAAAHDAGASCYPVLAAVDLNEANLLASTLTTKGDLLSTDGSDPKRVAVGSNNTRLVADSAQTAGVKWVADTQNTVVDAKGDLLVGTAADTVDRLAVGTNNQRLVAASGETTGLKWVADTQNTVVDAKGDLIVGTAADTVDRLAVGTNDYMIVANSSTASGLEYVPGGAWTSFTPTWKFGTNTVTVSMNFGYYSIINDTVIIKMGMRVSTYAGSGGLTVTIPSACSIASDTNYHRCGYGEVYDSSALLSYAAEPFASVSSTTVFEVLALHPGGGVSDSSPFSFGVSDEVWLTIIGRKA